jgi:hypothetical protein
MEEIGKRKCTHQEMGSSNFSIANVVEFQDKLTGNQQSCSGSADAVPFHTLQKGCVALPYLVYISVLTL